MCRTSSTTCARTKAKNNRVVTTKLYHEICLWLRELIKSTRWEGHVYAVGGCCRDDVMGFEIKDLDLAVSLPNGGIKFTRWLMDKHQIAGHPTFFTKFGTAKFRLRRYPEEEIEIVQTRKEQYTKETSRCPEMVFGSITEDCYRRDFTANSLYYDISRGGMLDLTGKGVADMKAGVLRTPMDPDATFHDDPVRILRGLRFAQRFGWTIVPAAYEAMMRHVDRIPLVSRERVHSELCKMLNGPDPVEMMQTLRRTGVFVAMMPLTQRLASDPAQWDAAMKRLSDLLRRSPEAPTRMRLAAMFIGLAPKASDAAKIAREIMTTLRFDRPIVSDVSYLVRYNAVTPAELKNPRYVRAMQNLASLPRRMDFLISFLTDLGRYDEAHGLISANQALLSSGKAGFNDPILAAASEKASVIAARTRHRSGRRLSARRRRRHTGK